MIPEDLAIIVIHLVKHHVVFNIEVALIFIDVKFIEVDQSEPNHLQVVCISHVKVLRNRSPPTVAGDVYGNEDDYQVHPEVQSEVPYANPLLDTDQIETVVELIPNKTAFLV